jgi:hypothetical protein
MAATVGTDIAAARHKYDWSLQADCVHVSGSGSVSQGMTDAVFSWPIQCWYDFIRCSCASESYLRYAVLAAILWYIGALVRELTLRCVHGCTRGVLYVLTGCCCFRPCRRRCCGGRCLFREEVRDEREDRDRGATRR